MQFSFSFNTAILSSPVVALGSGVPPGTALTVNPNDIAFGRIGILVDSTSTFAASPPARQVVTVTFNVAPGAPLGPTPLTFGDVPSARGFSDAFGNPLAATYTDGTVTVATAAPGFEGDVAPRPNGDSVVLSTDVIQLRRFATALDTPGGSELQRGDCAPRATLGDGIINATDVIQGRRYATALDPPTPVGGPMAPSLVPESITSVFGDVYAYFFGREMRIGSAGGFTGKTVTVPVEMVPFGDEVAAGFTLEYDSTRLANPQVALGEFAPQGAILTVNANEAGRIGILIDSTEAMVASAMPRQIVMVTFEVVDQTGGDVPISLTSSLAARGTSDANGNALSMRYVNGNVNISRDKLFR